MAVPRTRLLVPAGLALALLLILAALAVERETSARLERHARAQAAALERLASGEDDRRRRALRLAWARWEARDLPGLSRALADRACRGPAARILAGLLSAALGPASPELRGLDGQGRELTVERDGTGARVLGPGGLLELEQGDVPTALAATADGRLVLAFTGGEVRLAAEAGGTRLLTRHRGTVHALAAGPGGVLSGGYDGAVRLSPLDGGEGRVLAGHGTTVLALAWLGPERCASGDGAGRVLIQDLAAGGALREVRLGAPVRALQALPGALAALDGQGRLHLLPEGAGSLPRTWTLQEGALARGVAGGDRLIAVGLDGRAQEVDAAGLLDGGLALRSAGRGPVQDLDARGGRLLLGGADEHLRVLDLEEGRELAAWRVHRRGVSTVAAHPDGRTASAGADRRLCIHDPAGRLLLELPDHGRPVRELAWLGEDLVSVGLDGSVVLRPGPLDGSRPAPDPLHEQAGPLDGGVQCFALDRSGERLAWIADGGNLRVWDVRDGRRLAGLRAADLLRSSSIALEGERLAVGSRFEEGRLDLFGFDGSRTTVEGLRGAVVALAWMPGADLCLAATDRGALELVDGSGELLGRLELGEVPSSLAVSEDGRFVVAGGEGRVLVLGPIEEGP